MEPVLQAAPKVSALFDRLDATPTLERAGAVGAALDAVSTRVDVLPRALDQLDGLLASPRLERLGALVDRWLEDDAALDRVARLVERAEHLLADDRIDRLLDRLDAMLTEDNIRRIDALLAAVRPDVADRVLQRLDETLLPTSRELRQLPPDLHAMLELIDDLHQMVSGMPGATRARDRGDDPHPQLYQHRQSRPAAVPISPRIDSTAIADRPVLDSTSYVGMSLRCALTTPARGPGIAPVTSGY